MFTFDDDVLDIGWSILLTTTFKNGLGALTRGKEAFIVGGEMFTHFTLPKTYN